MKNSKAEKTLTGLGVAPGIAIGTACVIGGRGILVPEYALDADAIDDEIKRLHAAIAKTQRQLGQIKQKAASLPDGAEDITLLLEAYRGMLSGSRLVRGAEDLITTEKVNAEAAVQRQIESIRTSFAAMKDHYLASRADDVRDVGNRVIRNLLQQNYNPFADLPPHSIIIAEEITPADAALLHPDQVAGLVTVLGGPEGHSAIMARALGLPAVSGLADVIQGVSTDDPIILDGRAGLVILHPTSATLQHYRQEWARIQREDKKLRALRDIPASTTDGTTIKLCANLELPRDIDAALDAGAEGIGLLRTEFLFMNRPTLPDEEEQYQALVSMITKMDGRPLTVRTLDVGGEKLAAALTGTMGANLADSDNPALGLRAIRLGLKEPKLLDTQLAAILRASAHGPLRILIPMVSSISQMKAVRERAIQIEKRLHRRGIKLPGLPPIGAMIEIPAAALSADALARVSDFFAIGSNDLTQYTLAIDRGDEMVADLYDPFHPAVLRLIQFTTAAAWRANIPVSLCGEMAGDRRATALLLGLGLRDLSVSPKRLPPLKHTIRDLSMAQCVAFAETVMAKSNEADVRATLIEGIIPG